MSTVKGPLIRLILTVAHITVMDYSEAWLKELKLQGLGN